MEGKIRVVPAAGGDAVPEAVLSATAPLLLKGLVEHWPAVRAARESVDGAVAYLQSFYRGATVGAWFGGPEIGGRYFYNDDMSGFNYKTVMMKLNAVLETLRRHRDDPAAPAVYVGSTTVETCLPGFREQNDIGFGGIEPLMSVWLGNRGRVAAHFDLPDNLACTVVGRRRFTLFPPEQLENLYVGPLDFTPAGQSISLVDFADPDFERYPRFRTAMQHAQVAETEPGDAVFIPSMWWHHVEALESFNVLINYWWRKSPDYMGTPAGALNHALLTLRDLPKEQRKAWENIFRHYVFDADESTAAHVPERRRGVLSKIDETIARRLRAELLNRLNR
ncbi:MAG: cupin-like domain-containing protein [Woeseiaceae bacterium]